MGKVTGECTGPTEWVPEDTRIGIVMPEKLESFTSPSPIVDWEKYADGDVWKYIKGEDFRIKEQSFAAMARNWGARHGYVTHAHPKEGFVEVQFVKKDTPSQSE